MKKIILFPAIAILALSLSVSAQDSEKEGPKIQGSGHVITKDIPVQSFDQLDISGVFSVLLTQGDKPSVRIEAEDNLQQLFEVKNDGSVLSIEMKKHSNYNSKEKMKVY